MSVIMNPDDGFDVVGVKTLVCSSSDLRMTLVFSVVDGDAAGDDESGWCSDSSMLVKSRFLSGMTRDEDGDDEGGGLDEDEDELEVKFDVR